MKEWVCSGCNCRNTDESMTHICDFCGKSMRVSLKQRILAELRKCKAFYPDTYEEVKTLILKGDIE